MLGHRSGLIFAAVIYRSCEAAGCNVPVFKPGEHTEPSETRIC